jgi:hypothetical protein
MPSLKEQLQSRSSASTKTITLVSAPDVSVTIRRLTVRERNLLLGQYVNQNGVPNLEKDTSMSVAIVAKALVPEMSMDEVQDMDSAICDELATAITEFHGWTKKGRAELTDQFRPTT